jgi:hypothetical protein
VAYFNRLTSTKDEPMRRFLSFLVFLLLAIQASAIATLSGNPYPNELPGFKFYGKHLAPLRPYVSDRTLVVHVLGSDQGIELSLWRIRPYFVGERSTVNGHPLAHNVTGRLASVSIKPKQRVSMLGVKFPAAFTHSFGGVAEINVECDIYRDNFGLEYWIYAEDSAAGKKGDLMEIVYGPSRCIERQVVGPS